MQFETLTLRRALSATALLATAFAAQAQNNGYVHLGAGSSRFAVDCSGATTCDKTDSAFLLVGGYQFGGGLAAELLYAGLGKTTASVGTASGAIKANALGLGGAYQMPVGSGFSFNARLGLASVKMDTSTGGTAVPDSTSKRSANLYAGFGFGWSFSDSAAAELNYLSTRGKTADGDKGSISAMTVGVTLKF